MTRARYWLARLPWIPAIRRERFESLGCGLIGLTAFVLLAIAVGRLDARSAPIPLTVWNYHPAGAGAPHATVLCDTSVAPTLPFRPWRMFLNGGGFVPGTGTVPATYTPGSDALIDHWHANGDVVIFVGYTVDDSSVPGGGAFDPALWDGAPTALVISDDSLTHRHAEADVVHAIQSLRFNGIPGIPDIDTRPGRGVVYGRSVGSMLAWWVGGGRDRANRAHANPQRRVSTTVAATIHNPTIVHLSALPESYVQHHFAPLPGPLGNVADATLAAASVLRWGYLPKPPCHCVAADPQQFHGSHSWQWFQHVLNTTEIHPLDHVFAASLLPNHDPASVFKEPEETQMQSHAERAAWVDTIEAALQ